MHLLEGGGRAEVGTEAWFVAEVRRIPHFLENRRLEKDEEPPPFELPPLEDLNPCQGELLPLWEKVDFPRFFLDLYSGKGKAGVVVGFEVEAEAWPEVELGWLDCVEVCALGLDSTTLTGFLAKSMRDLVV